MGILDLFRKKVIESVVFPPPIDGIFLPQGCSRDGDMIIVNPEYSSQWFEKYPDKREAVKQMLAFLKKQYPAITRFHIRK